MVEVPSTRDDDLRADLAKDGLLDPMDLDVAPLFRARLYRSPDADADADADPGDGPETVLAFIVHHIIWDGTSAAILLTELCRLYDIAMDGRTTLAPPDAGQPATAELAAAPESPDQARDWLATLAGAPHHVWPLPPASERPAGLGVAELRPSPEWATALRELAGAVGVTPFVVGAACLAIALRSLHDGESVVLNTPISLRDEADGPQRIGLQRIGLRTSLSPLHLVPSAELTSRQLLSATRKSVLAAWRHRAVPFQRVVDEALRGRRQRPRGAGGRQLL